MIADPSCGRLVLKNCIRLLKKVYCGSPKASRMTQTPRPIHLLVLFFLLKANISAFAFSTNDANTIFSAYNSTFYTVSGTNGYFKNNQSGGVEYFWTQAE